MPESARHEVHLMLLANVLAASHMHVAKACRESAAPTMQVALGLEPKQGRHVVFLEYDGQKSVIGAVTPGVIEQFQIDFPVITGRRLPTHLCFAQDT